MTDFEADSNDGCHTSLAPLYRRQITAAVGMARSTISQHLKILAEVRFMLVEASGNATFDTSAPTWAAFDASRLPEHRLVACAETGRVLDWVAVSRVSARQAYAGVVEHSVYGMPAQYEHSPPASSCSTTATRSVFAVRDGGARSASGRSAAEP